VSITVANNPKAGTLANAYMSILDSTGRKDTLLLPSPLNPGETVVFTEDRYQPQDIVQIEMIVFSIDTWQFDVVEITIGDQTYTITNSQGKIIDKYGGPTVFFVDL